jgi:hypothetical protein
MNRIRREDAGDTGEQDVRELRRLYGGTPEAVPPLPLADAGPFVRDKEDVPHEDAIPDLYGLDNASEEDGVEEVLLQMVEDGELCFGWLEDRQEFGFWYPEFEPEQPADPAPASAPAPAHASHRRAKRRRLDRILMGVAATLTAPFAFTLYAHASSAADHDARHPMDQPDLTSDDVPVASEPAREIGDAGYQPQGASAAPMPAPSSAKRPRHAKPYMQPETPRAKASAAKHAKRTAPVTKGPSALLTGKPTVKVTLPASSTAPVPSTGKHEGPLSTVVNTLLAPVGALLGN